MDEVSDEDEAADIVNEDVQKHVKRKKKLKLAKALSDCVVICQSASYKSFEMSAQNCKSRRLLSPLVRPSVRPSRKW